MKKFFPTMFDIPERTLSIAGLLFGVICFYTFPFLTLFFSGGTLDSVYLSWFEGAYHGVNFFIILWLFRGYLKDSFSTIRYNFGSLIKSVLPCVEIMLAYAIILFLVIMPTESESLLLAANGTLPLVEIEIFNTSSNLIAVNPICGLVSVLIFSPVTMSCVYYASTFAPFCENRPWLAYLMMAVVLAIPRALSSLTFWPWEQNLVLYLVQLPLHLIACWAYEKADNIWAPIAVHTIANALTALLTLLLPFIYPV